MQLCGRLGNGQKEPLRDCGRYDVLQFYRGEWSVYRRVTMLEIMQASIRERNFRSGNSDPMIRPRREVALEPVRIVVELTPAEYTAIDEAIGWVPYRPTCGFWRCG